MLVLDDGHLAATHLAAVKQDAALRGFAEEVARLSASAGSVAEMVRRLREQGDYWERVQLGRLRTVKRLMARITQPFFRPQVRYNLLVAESLGHIEVTLAELRADLDRLRSAEPEGTARGS